MRSDSKADNDKKERLASMYKRAGAAGVACLLLPCQWFKRLFIRARSPGEERAADKQRQSEVRRELRGLPRDPDVHKPTASARHES